MKFSNNHNLTRLSHVHILNNRSQCSTTTTTQTWRRLSYKLRLWNWKVPDVWDPFPRMMSTLSRQPCRRQVLCSQQVPGMTALVPVMCRSEIRWPNSVVRFFFLIQFRCIQIAPVQRTPKLIGVPLFESEWDILIIKVYNFICILSISSFGILRIILVYKAYNIA
jgi:hypothetical protein